MLLVGARPHALTPAQRSVTSTRDYTPQKRPKHASPGFCALICAVVKKQTMRRLSTWLPLALVGGTLLAGCGSSTTTTETVGTTASAPAASTSTPAASTSTPAASASTPAASASTPAASSAAGVSGANHSSAKPDGQIAKRPKAPSGPPTSATSTAGTWHTTQCGLTMTFWLKAHPHSKTPERHAFKVSLTKAHGCFTERSLPG
jgi:hypothetical protein